MQSARAALNRAHEVGARSHRAIAPGRRRAPLRVRRGDVPLLHRTDSDVDGRADERRAAARAAFAEADQAAQALRGITDLVQVSASHANARDGLEASGVVATYELFKKRYGPRARAGLHRYDSLPAPEQVENYETDGAPLHLRKATGR